MAELVANCPRCGAKKITFDALSDVYLFTAESEHPKRHGYELFARCRGCNRSTIFVMKVRADVVSRNESLSQRRECLTLEIAQVHSYVNISDMGSAPPPEHLPAEIKRMFEEGSKCRSMDCLNAAGTMFRLCLDAATLGLLPPAPPAGDPPLKPGDPNAKQRRDLGLRLQWLFDLHDLASCIKDDGNDAAHRGSLTAEAADDIMDFTVALLERLYTEPKRVALAKARFAERNKKT